MLAMGHGVLVTTGHRQINLPEHAAKEAAFKASKLLDNGLGERGVAGPSLKLGNKTVPESSVCPGGSYQDSA